MRLEFIYQFVCPVPGKVRPDNLAKSLPGIHVSTPDIFLYASGGMVILGHSAVNGREAWNDGMMEWWSDGVME